MEKSILAPTPKILKPFSPADFQEIQQHVTEIRRLFDWPGVEYHDQNEPENQVGFASDNLPVGAVRGNKFNRWSWHNLPLLVRYHNDPVFVALASSLAGRPLKPTYVFLSMYGPEGICPIHTDRPQCQFTIDLQINSNGEWPIYVADKHYVLKNGDALFYSGTNQLHYRQRMQPPCTRMDLAFFHFAPIEWQGVRN